MRKERLYDCIVLIEDRRFYSHWGVDPIAVLRSIVANVRKRRYAQGGSTITQQLARTLYLSRDKTIFRKIVECLIAFRLELSHSKKDIMRMYASSVYMGHRSNGTEIRGFNEASKYYFKKLLRHATIAEEAQLVAMLKGPNLYRPGTEKGRVRQTWVLSLMADRGLISVDEMNQALGEMEKHALIEIIKTLDEGLDISFSRKHNVIFVRVTDSNTHRTNQKGVSSEELTRLVPGLNAGLAMTIERCRIELTAPVEAELPPDDLCCCGDSMENHASPAYCGHSPVGMRDYALVKDDK